jgi:hypothetical protein
LGSAGGVFFIVVALLSGGGPGVDDTNCFAALGEADHEETLLGRMPYDDLAGFALRVGASGGVLWVPAGPSAAPSARDDVAYG